MNKEKRGAEGAKGKNRRDEERQRVAEQERKERERCSSSTTTGKGGPSGTIEGEKKEKEKKKEERRRRIRISRKRRAASRKKKKKKKKKRWNSVVYPVIYNWKLGTTSARPKAICRFHPGESPPPRHVSRSLPKVIRPSTGIDARFGDSFLRLSLLLPLPVILRSRNAFVVGNQPFLFFCRRTCAA